MNVPHRIRTQLVHAAPAPKSEPLRRLLPGSPRILVRFALPPCRQRSSRSVRTAIITMLNLEHMANRHMHAGDS